jgi:hypothetical protein
VRYSPETLLALAWCSAYGAHDLPHVGSRCQGGASSCGPTAEDDPRETPGFEAFVEETGHEGGGRGAGGGGLSVNALEQVFWETE